MKIIYPLVITSCLAAIPFCNTLAQSIKGAGSSAAAPIYKSWAAEYQKVTNTALEYEPIGSSAGLKKIRENNTDFGASDVAPTATDLAKSGLIVFPIAITGVVPVLNVPSLPDLSLRLDGPVLAAIYLGEITNWNDARIKQLNPTLKLPNMPITVVVRSDGSGTTYNFADYLAKVSSQWAKQMGIKTSYTWTEGFIGARGSDGVVQTVKSTIGAIGYVDFGYVASNGLKSVQLQNANGRYVTASSFAFSDALAHSEWTRKDNFTATLTWQNGDGSWPITMGTFALLPKQPQNPQQTAQALDFFVWAFMNGDRLVQKNNFVRLPARMQALAFKTISTVHDKLGVPLGLKMIASAQ